MKMIYKKNNILGVWKPTGYREENALCKLWLLLSNPVFMISVAVVDVVAIIYFNLTSIWWMWAIAPSAFSLAIMATLLRWKAQGKLLISNQQAKKYNRFTNVAPWFPNRYLNLIDLESERSQDDHATSRLLYRYLVEGLVTLGLYEETKYTKMKTITDNEFQLIEPVEFYTDFILSYGIGYVLFEPSISLIKDITRVDEKVISRTLREIGLVNWEVKRVSFDDDIVMFILKDETVSWAYDFSGME